MVGNNKGNTFIISLFFICATIIIFFFVGAIFYGEMNSVAYNIKLDMYSLNKSAIIAVNKAQTSRGTFSYDKKAYKEQFENLLKKNYSLDDKLINETGIIKQVKIKEYDIYKNGSKDNYTHKKHDDMVIHSVIEVKLKPIFNFDVLKKICTFDIHEDVVLNELII